MKITIEGVDNGYIVEAPNPMGEGRVKVVFDTDSLSTFNDNKGECEVIVHLLYEIMEHLCMGGSKHDTYRVRPVLELTESGELTDGYTVWCAREEVPNDQSEV